jgi:hypothetical protein
VLALGAPLALAFSAWHKLDCIVDSINSFIPDNKTIKWGEVDSTTVSSVEVQPNSRKYFVYETISSISQIKVVNEISYFDRLK